MKEAHVAKDITVQVVDVPVPTINDDQVLIKVVASGSNPKDWKLPYLYEASANTNPGDDIAGIVEQVGKNVFEFKKGDRVAAFHEMTKPGGSFAEYAVAWQHTTFHIPHNISFEEAAAIPLAAMTAVVGLYDRLKLPQPWSPEAKTQEPTPLIIYGASSAVGIYALQFAQRSNIHPVICVAGQAKDYVRGFIDESKGDIIIDYREGDDAVVAALQKATEGKQCNVFDGVAYGPSVKNLGRVLKKGSHVTYVLGTALKEEGMPEDVQQSITMVGDVHNEHKDLGYVYFRYIARGLQEGWFKPQRTEVVPGGLGGVEYALRRLKEGKASAVKYVFRIADTEGV
ncbi:alcohol dehydrogenase [Podospora australis]|uniref:Alcohol dehydrogenase n=1 Tax=Podospora australis TaxID=1536484 RepID=A0AAN6WNB1_9PEZI|nr:alcohol dehydrogenase [Podospora australis]